MAQNLKINILAQDKTKQAFNGIRGKLAGLKNAVFSLRGAFLTLGAGLAVKSFVSTGRSIEDLQVRLKQLFGTDKDITDAGYITAHYYQQLLAQKDDGAGDSFKIFITAEKNKEDIKKKKIEKYQ